MSDEEAKYYFREIKAIRGYETIIEQTNKELRTIGQQINDIQTPSSPQGNTGPKIENHCDKSSLINSLLSEEMELIEKRNEFEKLKFKAERYFNRLKSVCSEKDIEFINAYVNGMNYQKMKRVFNIEHPWRYAIQLVKSVHVYK